MKEYIERAAILQAIEESEPDVMADYGEYYGSEWGFSRSKLSEIIRGMPAADVVEVIRCHNCKRIYANANDPGVIYCGWSKEPTPPDGYCHRGERTHGQGGRA